MRIFGEITKTTENPDGTIRVQGIASTETVDSDGEVILASAIKAALPDYLRFPAVRVQHDPQRPAGTALAIEVAKDKRTHIDALVVDPTAVAMVKTGVLRGFSIGGRVLPGGRSKTDPKVIERIDLTEISLVDRPAHPEAVIEVWKADHQLDLPACAECSAKAERLAKLQAHATDLEARLARAAADHAAAVATLQGEHGAALAKASGQRDTALAKVASAEDRIRKVEAERDAARVELFKRPKGYLAGARARPVEKAADVDALDDDADEPLTPAQEIAKVHRQGGRLLIKGR